MFHLVQSLFLKTENYEIGGTACGGCGIIKAKSPLAFAKMIFAFACEDFALIRS